VPNWTSRATDALASFIASPMARLKDQCNNLVVLIGYMIALPVTSGVVLIRWCSRHASYTQSNTLLQLLPTTGARRRLWLALAAESVRRATEVRLCVGVARYDVTHLLTSIELAQSVFKDDAADVDVAVSELVDGGPVEGTVRDRTVACVPC
jgi:hypothetical protein